MHPYSIKQLTVVLALAFATLAGFAQNKKPMSQNPVIDGWYADPQIRIYGDTYWIFATYSHDFDDQTFMDCFSSKDLVTWTKHKRILDAENISWIKYALWAPDAHEKDGKYYIFFGANDTYPIEGTLTPRDPSEKQYGGIGVAVADKPEGPYKDLIGKPLIDQFWNRAQPIDQYVFKYEGSYYMIYGGWGRCNIVKLADDFKSIVPFPDGEIAKEITPKGYTEGSVMFERKGKWYFMWSEGAFTGPDYKVAYGIADTPFGPFERLDTILEQDGLIANGAGHHSVMNIPGTDDWYICYHRRPMQHFGGNHRTTCIDRMYFNEDGTIKPIIMTNDGVEQRFLKKPKGKRGK